MICCCKIVREKHLLRLCRFLKLSEGVSPIVWSDYFGQAIYDSPSIKSCDIWPLRLYRSIPRPEWDIGSPYFVNEIFNLELFAHYLRVSFFQSN